MKTFKVMYKNKPLMINNKEYTVVESDLFEACVKVVAELQYINTRTTNEIVVNILSGDYSYVVEI